MPALVEGLGDIPVDDVLSRRQLQRGKEDSRNLSCNELPAGLRSLLFNIGRVAQRTPPEQDVLSPVLSLRHPPAYWFKYFRAAELRYEQPERIAIYPGVCPHVAAGTGASLDEARQLQFA
jgi:hypothetical protein